MASQAGTIVLLSRALAQSEKDVICRGPIAAPPGQFVSFPLPTLLASRTGFQGEGMMKGISSSRTLAQSENDVFVREHAAVLPGQSYPSSLPTLLASRTGFQNEGLTKEVSNSVALPSWFRPPPGLSLPGEGVEKKIDTMSDGAALGGLESKNLGMLMSHLQNADDTVCRDDFPPPPPFALPLPPPDVPGITAGTPKSKQVLPQACSEATRCPSVGSAYHHIGLCVPCDFVDRAISCRAGAACTYCHLCGPKEIRQKKRLRKKLKAEKRFDGLVQQLIQ